MSLSQVLKTKMVWFKLREMLLQGCFLPLNWEIPFSVKMRIMCEINNKTYQSYLNLFKTVFLNHSYFNIFSYAFLLDSIQEHTRYLFSNILAQLNKHICLSKFRNNWSSFLLLFEDIRVGGLIDTRIALVRIVFLVESNKASSTKSKIVLKCIL